MPPPLALLFIAFLAAPEHVPVPHHGSILVLTHGCVTVELMRKEGARVGQRITCADPPALFEDLPPGDYEVRGTLGECHKTRRARVTAGKRQILVFDAEAMSEECDRAH